MSCIEYRERREQLGMVQIQVESKRLREEKDLRVFRKGFADFIAEPPQHKELGAGLKPQCYRFPLVLSKVCTEQRRSKH